MNINTIIQAAAPANWDKCLSYYNGNYATVEVESYSNEFRDIRNELLIEGMSTSIKKIERVQHPFALARFLLRKEQLEQRHGYNLTTMRKFRKVRENKLEEFLQYNLDERRVQSISFYNISTDVIVATRKLNINNTRDCEEYPEYVIYFDN